MSYCQWPTREQCIAFAAGPSGAIPPTVGVILAGQRAKTMPIRQVANMAHFRLDEAAHIRTMLRNKPVKLLQILPEDRLRASQVAMALCQVLMRSTAVSEEVADIVDKDPHAPVCG